MEITAFLDESINNTFKDLEAFGVAVPAKYTKSSYSYIIFNGSPVLEKEIPKTGYIISMGQKLIDLDIRENCFNLSRGLCSTFKKDINAITRSGMSLNKALYICSLTALKQVLTVLIRKGFHKSSKITIFTDNQRLATIYELDPSLIGFVKRYKKDEEVVKTLKEFEDIKILWISREYNQLADSFATKLTKTLPNMEILGLTATRIRELENLIMTGSEGDLLENLYKLKYLVDKSLYLIEIFPYNTLANDYNKLLLLVIKRWLEQVKKKIDNIEKSIVKQYSIN